MDDVEIKKIERKLKKALERKETKEVKDLYIELAAYLTRYDDNEGGLEAYKKALSICKSKGWEFDSAVVHRMIGETYCALGEYEEAVNHANMYLNYAQKSNDKIEEQRGYATLGRIYFCWAEFRQTEKLKSKADVDDNLNKSLSAYEESLKICLNDLNNINVREKEEMKSRLFQNLGLVMCSLKNYKEANSNFTIAIQINKAQNFKENLYWCYLSQSECFLKAGECASACTYCDLAAKAASTKSEEFDAFKLKAKALLKFGKILNAKFVLRDMYKKLQGKDREVTELLRITIFLCKVEKMIESTPDNAHMEKKNLYERKGDAYCALKLYEQGAQAYLKMLNYAEKICKSREELLPCYTSLSQTFRDCGKYSFAVFYCNHELEVINENSSEASKTRMFLAELYEMLDSNYNRAYGEYEKALEIARKIGDKAQEAVVLKALIQVQTDMERFAEADGSRKALEEVKKDLSDFTDDECNDEVNEESFDFDVDDSELLSDDEDIKARHQARRACYKVKRNQKGETDLHVASIRGDLNKVKKLLQNGHPVNERDLAGWSVLHEASNHGHAEIVSLLLDNGANVNDPGGEDCDGITPLHDAAENGHFNVIKVLLKGGACKAVLTNRGDTPLDCLKRWRGRTTLSPGQEIEYEEACNALKSNLDSAVTKEKRRRLVSTPTADKPTLTSGHEITIDDEEEEEEQSSATEMYRLAMESVRRRPESKLDPKRMKKPKPALISEEEVVEEWLEEDVKICGQPSKKRKIQGNSSTASEVVHRYEEEVIDVELIPEPMEGDSETDVSVKSRSLSPVLTVTKTNFQLMEEPDVRKEPETGPPINEKSTPEQSFNNAVEKSPEAGKIWRKFKVPLMDDVFLIPVLESEMSNLTVQWLADSVAERYNKVYGRKPEILLTTGDNAITIGNDPLSVLANEEIKTRVLEWKKLSLGDMYVQLARDLPQSRVMSSLLPVESKPSADVANALNNFDKTGDLILRDKNLECGNFLPVLEVLRKTNRNVKIMDLSRNYLGDEIIDPLMDFLEKSTIRRLYLISNGITGWGVKRFYERISALPEENLSRINCVDFSFSNLGDDSVEFLNLIIDKLKNLDYLGTEYCGLTRQLKELTVSNSANPVDGNDTGISAD